MSRAIIYPHKVEALREQRIMVWKFVMEHPRSVFDVPSGALFLSVGLQDDQIVLWAEVSPSAEKEQRVFNAINTGSQLPPDRIAFIGTVQTVGKAPGTWVEQPIVWHVYEVER